MMTVKLQTGLQQIPRCGAFFFLLPLSCLVLYYVESLNRTAQSQSTCVLSLTCVLTTCHRCAHLWQVLTQSAVILFYFMNTILQGSAHPAFICFYSLFSPPVVWIISLNLHFFFKWIKFCSQECPKCHVTIEKDGGCNHMVCRNQNCKAEFCWVCLGPWEPHGSAW